jgi:hypothetical protein
VTISNLRAELVKARGCVAGGQDISRNVQEGIAATHTNLADVEIHQHIAGIDSSTLEIVVEVPFRIDVRVRLDAKARHQWREMPGTGQESNGREVSGGREDVTRSCDQRPARGFLVPNIDVIERSCGTDYILAQTYQQNGALLTRLRRRST